MQHVCAPKASDAPDTDGSHGRSAPVPELSLRERRWSRSPPPSPSLQKGRPVKGPGLREALQEESHLQQDPCGV